MSEPEKEKIIVFDAEAEPQIGPDGRPIQTRGISDALKRVVFKANEITVDQVQRNVTQFLSSVQNILAEGALYLVSLK